jgi:hypothetical protein
MPMLKRPALLTSISLPAALKSDAVFGERYRSRLLHEIVKNDSRSDGNNAGGKACGNEHTHRVLLFR